MLCKRSRPTTDVAVEVFSFQCVSPCAASVISIVDIDNHKDDSEKVWLTCEYAGDWTQSVSVYIVARYRQLSTFQLLLKNM